MNEILIFDYHQLTIICLDINQKVIENGPYKLTYLNSEWQLESEDGLLPVKIKMGYQILKRPNTFYHILIRVRSIKKQRFICFENDVLTINQTSDASIQVFDPLLKNFNCVLKECMIFSNFQFIYVNSHKYCANQILQNGDVINFGPLTIIYNEHWLLIDIPENCKEYKVNLKPLNSRDILFEDLGEETNCLVEPHRIYLNNCPDFKYIISKNGNDSILRPHSQSNLGLIQGLITSVGLVAMALLNYYLGKVHGRSDIELLQIILMPMVMVCGTLLIPLIDRLKCFHQERKSQLEKKLAFDQSLKTFESELKQDIKTFQNFIHQFDFDEININERLKGKQFYEIESNDYGFGLLNLGVVQIQLVIKYNAEDFDLKENAEITKVIEHYHSQSSNYLIDLKEYRLIVIEGEDSYVWHYTLTLLYKLAVSHNYHDLKIALILDGKDEDKLWSFKNIAHLYYENERLIFYREDDLKLLEKVENYLVIFDFTSSLKEVKGHDVSIIAVNLNHQIYKNKDLVIHVDEHLINNLSKSQKLHYDDLEALKVYPTLIDKLPLYHLKEPYSQNQKVLTLFNFYSKDLDLNQRYKSLKNKAAVLIGLNSECQKLYFDLSEKGIGPHLLIAGATGSGKSELVLALLLGIALNYRSDEASIALIDYKGTGLKETLSYHNQVLPHLSLNLTNLNPFEFDRSLTAFKFELLRREKLFKQLAERSESSIMNLYDYRLNNRNYKLPNLGEFFIIIDEFAELKKERPQFMHEINRIARVGRSLGFHLILVTQKLGGVIDQEINANISARIALKVNTEEDSYEMLHSKDAYYLKHPGEFFVLSKDGLTKGRAIYTRAFVDCRNHETVNLVNHQLKSQASYNVQTSCQTRQISYFIEKIILAHRDIENNYSIFLKPLADLTYRDLIDKYHRIIKKCEIIVGEYDDYQVMNQGLLIHSLKNQPFSLIYLQNLGLAKNWLNNVLSSLIGSEMHIVLITRNLLLWRDYQSYVEMVDANKIDDLIYLCNQIKDINYKVLVLIDDYEILKDVEELNNELIKLMLRPFNDYFYLQILVSHGQKIPYRYTQLFTIYSESKNKEELTNRFGTYNEFSENLVYQNEAGRLVGFKMAINSEIHGRKLNHKIINQIPHPIKCIHTSNKVLIGYFEQERFPLYLTFNEQWVFISWYDDLLKGVRNLVGEQVNFTYFNYREIKSLDGYDRVIWIGPHLKDQYLFIPKINHDLNRKQAYVYTNLVKEVIELIEQ